jgi:hypothetical protein
MKQPAKSPHVQLNLSLLNVSPAAVPADKQRELTDALVEFLISAAGEVGERQANGGEDESEAHR